jgi:microcystin-dependent protein
MKKLSHILTVAAALGFTGHNAFAQVGIGNPSPNASSILDLTNSNDKFLLLPIPTAAPSTVTNFTSGPAGLLLYYNDNLYFKTSAGIKSVTPWLFDGTAANGVSTPTGTMPVGIGVAPIASQPIKLQIADAPADVSQTSSNAILMLGSATTTPHLMMDGDEILAKSNATTAGTLKLQEDGGFVTVRSITADAGETAVLTAFGTIDAKGKIQENGNNLIPMGTILLYHGAAAPAGWALCDGGTYPRQDGAGNVTVPDLRNRFVVGSGATYPYNTSGGSATFTITIPNLPSHTHSINHGHTINDPTHTHNFELHDEGGGGKIDDSGTDQYGYGTTEPASTGITVNNHVGNSGPTGGGTAVTHVPPYYSLTYIYKL